MAEIRQTSTHLLSFDRLDHLFVFLGVAPGSFVFLRAMGFISVSLFFICSLPYVEPLCPLTHMSPGVGCHWHQDDGTRQDYSI